MLYRVSRDNYDYTWSVTGLHDDESTEEMLRGEMDSYGIDEDELPHIVNEGCQDIIYVDEESGIVALSNAKKLLRKQREKEEYDAYLYEQRQNYVNAMWGRR